MKLYFSLLFLLFGFIINAQSIYTIYDDVPGNNKSCKPAYQDDYPEWAKMLYSDDIDFQEIETLFTAWEEKNTGNHRPIRRYYKNWSRCIQPWTSEDGTIELPDLQQYSANLLQTQKYNKKSSQSRAGSDWTFVGPKETFWLNESGWNTPPLAAPWQVNIYSFDVSKTNGDVLYCGTETGYVNKTTDKGKNWSQMGLDYNFGGGVTATAIDPENEDVVYVAAGNQIHKTVDGGESWTPLLSTSSQFSADRLEIDKSDSNTIFAAGNSGIFVSYDGGANWFRNYHLPAYDIHRHPTNPDIVYGLTKSSGNFQIVISQDGGGLFLPDNNFPSDIEDQAGGLLAVSEASPNSIFAILLTNNFPKLYKRDNDSDEWNLIANGGHSNFPMNNGQGYFDLVLEVSDQDADLVFAGTSTLYKSTDGGGSFTIVGGYGGAFSIHPDIQDMKILSDGEVWVSTDGGMNYSSDNFTYVSNHLAKINGIIGSDMWGFDQGWNEDLVVGGRYHNGNTSIADFYGDKALRMGGAESPTGWVLKGKSRHVAFNDLGAGWILPETAEGQPEGRFLFSKYPTMDEYGGRRGNIVTHPNYFGTLLVGEGDILWKSEDSGMSYDMIHDFGKKVRYIDMAYSNPSVMYADVIGDGLYRSDDGGYSWVEKPSLTSPSGIGNFGGRLFFAISPNNENTLYACLQNGTWSSNIGTIFKSIDGGDTWEDWTGTLSEYTKNLVVQPDANGEDIVYLFTNARDKEAKVFMRDGDSTDWEEFDSGFPAGFHVNLAMPFYRDSKLRVAGNAGIWESPLAEPNFQPILNPWVEKQVYSCIYDTVYFDDHSMIDHEGCTWEWNINPQPEYISDATVRNPVVVLGQEGSFDVTMTIRKNGVEHVKEIIGMISASTCPSIEDCNNPDQLPKDIWDLVYVDSEEPLDPGLAVMAFDNDPSTIWHTRWTSGNDTYPHEIVVDMGDEYRANSFTYLPRQIGANGRVKDYELYVSSDNLDWGEPISVGQFENSHAPSIIEFDNVAEGRYFRLVCLSEVNGNIWASAAELSLEGCYATSVSNIDILPIDVKAFPVPSNGYFEIDLPFGKKFDYNIYDERGMVVQNGKIDAVGKESFSFDLTSERSGTYFIRLIDARGLKFSTKVVLIR